jgi:hypothetical protein
MNHYASCKIERRTAPSQGGSSDKNAMTRGARLINVLPGRGQ